MDFLKPQLDRIQQQLSGLNSSQKMLAACLVAIIVMTVAWWGRQAGSSEMAPLFKEAMEAGDAGRIKHLLTARGIRVEIGADNLISVPAAQLNQAFAELAVSEAMPKNPSINFDSFMKGINPFASSTLNEAHLVHFKQARLSEVIREFPGVKSAEVFIDPTQKFGMNASNVEMAATVNIRAKDPKAISQALVDGAANLVMGAQAGLSWKRVTVMVDGALRRVSDPEMRGSDDPDLLERRERYQQIYADKVANLLNIPGLSVSVTFDLNGETVRKRKHSYDKATSLSLPSETEEKSRESTGGGGVAGGEPGAMPNTSMSVGGGPIATSGGDSSSTESETRSKFENFPSDVVEESVKFAGLGSPRGAAVMVPRSHVVNVLKFESQDPKEPDRAQIEEWFKRQLPDLQKMVKTAVGLTSEEAVSMALYTDLIPPQPAGAGGAAAAGGLSIATVAGTHSREIMLGGLAVVSLFMVSMMVRRGGPAIVAMPVGIQQSTPMPVLDATEALAGEVGEGKSMLDAMELDEDAVRAQQMVDQVAAMVEDNPDAAAGLVKRWMSRT